MDVSFLEGSEGLYAHATREMVQAGDFWQLSYLEELYRNQLPLLFWLLAFTEEPLLRQLTERGDLSIETLREFYQPKGKNYDLATLRLASDSAATEAR